MRKELLEQDDIGSLRLAAELCRSLKSEARTEQELREYVSDASYEIANSLTGLLFLLSYLGYIEISDGTVSLKNIESDTQVISKLFQKMSKDGMLQEFLNHKTVDMQSDGVAIRNELVPREYFQTRNFLLKSSVLVDVDGNGELLHVDQKYTDIFLRYIEKPKKSLMELEKELEAKKKRGAEAEKFVLEYEQEIRQNHPSWENIRIISEEDVGAGYDIESYQSDASTKLDKFIEVKSYFSSRHFYWSRNEREKAKQWGSQYCLYIVDSSRIDKPGYKPKIIENPYKRLKDAKPTCESWKYDLDALGSSEAE